MKKFLIIYCISLFCFGFTQSQESNNLVFFVNKAIAEDSFTSVEIEDIYYGDKTIWKNKNKIVPTYLNIVNEAGEKFFNNIIKSDINEYNRHWIKLIFSGYSQAPKKIETTDEIINYVNTHKNAIGFVLQKDVKLLKYNCKIIKITK